MAQYRPNIILRLNLSFPGNLSQDLLSSRATLEEDDDIAILFRERVWRFFTSDKINECGSSLRQDYPWLLEFEKGSTEEFLAAFSYFEHDPSSLIDILQAYGTLIDCEVVKRNMVVCLRNAASGTVRELKGYRVSILSRLLRKFKLLENVQNDDQFLEEYMNIDYFAIYDHCLRLFTDDRPGWLDDTGDKVWKRNRERIRQFIRLVPPCENGIEFQSLSSCILSLRTKALARFSESRERELQAEIKKLKEDKEKPPKPLEVSNRAVTDMSYRHLLEMLPIARQAANGASNEPNPNSSPEWRAFWKDAWAAAGHGKAGPLNELYNRSNKRKRTEIEEEGGRLYGVLSANLHDFEKEYNVDMDVRDRIPGLILSALKPQNFTADGDVDWDKEVRRFV